VCEKCAGIGVGADEDSWMCQECETFELKLKEELKSRAVDHGGEADGSSEVDDEYRIVDFGIYERALAQVKAEENYKKITERELEANKREPILPIYIFEKLSSRAGSTKVSYNAALPGEAVNLVTSEKSTVLAQLSGFFKHLPSRLIRVRKPRQKSESEKKSKREKKEESGSIADEESGESASESSSEEDDEIDNATFQDGPASGLRKRGRAGPAQIYGCPTCPCVFDEFHDPNVHSCIIIASGCPREGCTEKFDKKEPLSHSCFQK
jgi:hypothetical protein